MLMYQCVHSAFFTLKFYYTPHSSNFCKTSYNVASYLPSVGFGQVNDQIKDVFEKEK